MKVASDLNQHHPVTTLLSTNRSVWPVCPTGARHDLAQNGQVVVHC